MLEREVGRHASRETGAPGKSGEGRTRTRLRDRRARRRACRRLFLEEFLRGLRLLRVASGTRVKARRVLRRASWHRRGRVADFRGGGRLLRGERESARSRASWAARFFWVRVDSQG